MNLRILSKPIVLHLLFLICFCFLLVLIWRVPVLLIGDVYDVFPLLAPRNFGATGLFSITDSLGRFLSTSMLAQHGVPSAVDGRLSDVILGYLSHFIEWNNLVGWTIVSSVTISGCVIFWWLTVYRLFDAKIAWISALIFAFLPLYWREALWLDAYNFALLFFFASFCAFVWLQKKSLILASIVSGLLFGMSIASKDVLLVIMPWIFLGSIWMFSNKLKKIVIPLVLFFFCSGLIYIIPHIGDIATYGHPFNQNIARLWPGEQQTQNAFYLHFYPDPYTNFFDREYFDAKILDQMVDLPLLDRIQMYKILINFDVGSYNFVTNIGNGFWLLMNMIPGLFQQENFGGAMLWIFIIPGMVFLWRNNRKLFIILIGTLISSEFIIRFIMHYSRNHLMDIGWILTLFAAVGICVVANSLFSAGVLSKRTSIAILSVLLIVQLVQGNRILLANQYRHTRTGALRSISSALEDIPIDSVVASGLSTSNTQQVAFLADRTIALFAPETVEHLLKENKLYDAFELYGVTHAIGYDNTIILGIQEQIPSIQIVLASGEPVPVAVTTFQRFLLHLIR